MTEAPFSPRPPIEVGGHLRRKPPNRYRLVGVALLFTPVIPGLLLWAMVSMVIGEEVLEGDDQIPMLGTAILFVPNVIGGILVLVSQTLNERLPLTPLVMSTSMFVIGLAATALAIYSMASTEVGDTNIGAGLVLCLAAGLLASGHFTRQRLLAQSR